tara:strand:- start:137 stop:379 length:243 start_codon:yes stop_codon:yes gene_type:complete
MITFYGNKVTANELAKLLILDRLECLMDFSDEAIDGCQLYEGPEPTKAEREAIKAQIEKRFAGIYSYLGADKLYDKTTRR